MEFIKCAFCKFAIIYIFLRMSNETITKVLYRMNSSIYSSDFIIRGMFCDAHCNSTFKWFQLPIFWYISWQLAILVDKYLQIILDRISFPLNEYYLRSMWKVTDLAICHFSLCVYKNILYKNHCAFLWYSSSSFVIIQIYQY